MTKLGKYLALVGLLVATFYAGRYSGIYSGTQTTDTKIPKRKLSNQDSNFVAKNSPQEASVHYFRYNRDQRRKTSETRALLQKAIEMSVPSKGEASFEEVVSMYEKVLAEEPKNTKAFEFYSNFLILEQEYDAALHLLKKCLELDPKNELCNGNLTNLYLMKEKSGELEEALDNCLKHGPNNGMCLFNQGQHYLRTRRFARSLAIFKRLERNHRDSSISFSDGAVSVSIAMSYEGLGDTERALEYHEKACEEGHQYSCNLL